MGCQNVSHLKIVFQHVYYSHSVVNYASVTSIFLRIVMSEIINVKAWPHVNGFAVKLVSHILKLKLSQQHPFQNKHG